MLLDTDSVIVDYKPERAFVMLDFDQMQGDVSDSDEEPLAIADGTPGPTLPTTAPVARVTGETSGVVGVSGRAQPEQSAQESYLSAVLQQELLALDATPMPVFWSVAKSWVHLHKYAWSADDKGAIPLCQQKKGKSSQKPLARPIGSGCGLHTAAACGQVCSRCLSIYQTMTTSDGTSSLVPVT